MQSRLDNPDIPATMGTQNRLWVVNKRQRKLKLQKSKMDSPDIPTILGTHEAELQVVSKRQRKPKGQSRIDNPETLATLGTIHRIMHVQSNIVLSKSNTPTILVFKLSVQMYLTIIMMAPYAYLVLSSKERYGNNDVLLHGNIVSE